MSGSSKSLRTVLTELASVTAESEHERKVLAETATDLLPSACVACKGVLSTFALPAAGAAFVAFLVYHKWRKEKDHHHADQATAELLSGIKQILESERDDQARKAKFASYLTGNSVLPPGLKHDYAALLAELIIERTNDNITNQVAKILDLFGDQPADPLIARLYGPVQDLSIDSPLRKAAESHFEQLRYDRQDGILGQLSQILKQTGAHFNIEIPKPANDRTQLADSPRSLVYSERLVPRLVGRSPAFEKLLAFRDSDTPISWWAWFGEGGMGKSRLALEFLYDSLGEWQGGFVQDGFPEPQDLGDWLPTRPTLFVVDYAARYAESCREFIAYLHSRKSELADTPIRILLLDRYWSPDGTWFRTLLPYSPHGNAVRTAAWLSTASSEPVAESLGALTFDEFFSLFLQADFILRGSRITLYQEQQARDLLNQPKFLHRRLRPLYACLYAYAAVKVGIDRMEEWGATDVEEFVLQREADLWGKASVTQCDVNAVFLATLQGGLPLLPDEGMKPCIKDADEGRCQIVASHSADARFAVPPIEPDILGEAFVKLRLKGELFANGSKKTVIDCSWRLFGNALTMEEA
jgi:hypothetical protein